MMVPVLTGTFPIRPYHPAQFFGTIKADGQLPKVAALACHHHEAVAISLVGYDTSVSAALARLWQREQLVFEPDTAIDWHGPVQLGRRQENYKQFHVMLPGTKEVVLATWDIRSETRRHPQETGSKLAVVITYQILRSLPIRGRFSQLLGYPGISRRSCHADMDHSS